MVFPRPEADAGNDLGMMKHLFTRGSVDSFYRKLDTA
jgi:hypothetical protein